MEVMGLMLGQYLDDYTITCVDVFAMPQVMKIRFLLVVHFTNDAFLALARYWRKC